MRRPTGRVGWRARLAATNRVGSTNGGSAVEAVYPAVNASYPAANRRARSRENAGGDGENGIPGGVAARRSVVGRESAAARGPRGGKPQ